MSCPTCSRTMSAVAERLWHCGTCGTLVGCYADGAAAVPRLVTRCREFATDLRLAGDAALTHAWRVLGIHEAIRTESERKESS